MSTNSFLIWGAGAIGGTIGAFFARAGHDVTLVDTHLEHVERIRSEGLHIFGPVEDFTVKIPAFLPEELNGQYSRILLAVKTLATEAALVSLTPHLAANGYVASFQNGLCEPLIADHVGKQRTMGAFINFGADWHGPGEIMYGNRGAVVVGEIDGQMTPRLSELHRALLDFDADAIQTNQVFAHLWGKLAYLTLLYSQALGQLGIGDCLARPELRQLWDEILAEANAVAHAEGVKPVGFDGFDPEAFGSMGDKSRRDISIQKLVDFNLASSKTHSGIWRDLAVRKRKTEVAQQVEQIAVIGRQHAINTPRVDRLVQMIREIEDGRRPLDDANLLELAA